MTIRTLVAAAMVGSTLSACSSLEAPAPTSQRPALTLSLDPAGSLVNLAPAPLPLRPDAFMGTLSLTPAMAGNTSLVVDPLAPEQAFDLNAPATQVDLWERIRSGFAMAELDSPLVRDREVFYAGKPDNFRRMTERGSRYLYHVVEEIQKRGMPTELALLPFVESAFNPQAMSVAKASGMWQFVPATGRDYDLKQNVFRDDRRDVLASTRAALDYLSRLNNLFNDWHLALAAYNWGEGNVQKAVARNLKAGLPTDFASLKMPDETRYYVPKLLALKNIIAAPQAYAVDLPPLKNHPYFLSVPIDRDIDVDLASRLAGISLDEFKQLNPQMNKPVILAAGTEQVLLPYDNANQFLDNMRAHRGPLASWTAWVAPKALRPADAAKLVGMSETQMREVNRIPPRMLVSAGSALLVPRTSTRTADVSEELADNARLGLEPDRPPLRRLVLRASKKGDSVAAVAKRYGTTAAQVASWNKVAAGGSFKPGSSIVVYVSQSATRLASAAGGSRNARVLANNRIASPQRSKARPAAKPAVRVAQR